MASNAPVDIWCIWWLLGNGWRKYWKHLISEFQVGITSNYQATIINNFTAFIHRWIQRHSIFHYITCIEGHILEPSSTSRTQVFVWRRTQSRDLPSPGVPVAQWLEPLTGVTVVVGPIPTWTSEMFSVVPSPVGKQLSFTCCTLIASAMKWCNTN